jgi:hypothetical protein
MKLLGFACGLIVSLGMLVVGVLGAIVIVTEEPPPDPLPSLNVTDLWTAEPRRISRATQDLIRVPALQTALIPLPSKVVDAKTGANGVDPIKTTSVARATLDRDQILASSHSQWCTNRYRSYRSESNTYMRYDGSRWPCVSPYSKQLRLQRRRLQMASTAAADESARLPWLNASLDENETFYDSDHVSYCHSRYRSYRPEDNTYQPYRGGPRRQCR